MTFPPQQETNARKQKLFVLLICAGLAAMVFLVFGQTLCNGFINFDDDLYVYANPHVAQGFTSAGIVWAFFSCRPTGNWHPLTWLSHMLDCQLYGLNPAGHHLTNLCLHAATAILLFQLLRQMTGALWPSAVVAGLFAVHPLRVESVAWIAERKDLLSGFLFMLTLLMYVQFFEQSKTQSSRSKTFYGLTLLCFTLGLLSKPMLVTLPFVLLLLDFWPLQRFTGGPPLPILRPLLVEKLPFFLLATISCAVTFFSQKSAGALAEVRPLLRLENSLVSYVAYVLKMFWPEPLALLYPFPSAVPVWQAAGAGVVLLFITVLAAALARRFPYLLMGWLWYLGMLVPVIGIAQQAGGQAMADRYSYLPQIGLVLALVWGVKDFAASRGLRRFVSGLAAAGVLVVLMAGSFRQITFWRNSELLWEHTIACTSANPMAQIELAIALRAQGRLDEAIEHFQTAIQIRPDRPNAYVGLGNALVRKGRFAEAIESFSTAVQIRPDDAEVQNNLANLLAAQGRFAEATPHYETAIRLVPDYAEAHNNLANLLASQDRFAEAVGHYQAAIRLKPGYSEAHYNFAKVLAAHARLDEAVEEFRIVIHLKPDDANAHGNLANVLVGQNKLDEAVREFQQTLKLEPNSDQAHFKLGLALEKLGRKTESRQQFQAALQLNPSRADIKKRLQLLDARPD